SWIGHRSETFRKGRVKGSELQRPKLFTPPFSLNKQKKHYGIEQRRSHRVIAERSPNSPSPRGQNRSKAARLSSHAQTTQHAGIAPVSGKHGSDAHSRCQGWQVRRSSLRRSPGRSQGDEF